MIVIGYATAIYVEACSKPSNQHMNPIPYLQIESFLLVTLILVNTAQNATVIQHIKCWRPQTVASE